jgi:predicted nucleotide-binding protein
MRWGLPAFKNAFEDLVAFNPKSITKRWGPEVKALETAIEENLSAVFGHNTVQYNRYRRAAALDHGNMIMGRPATIQQAQQYVTEGQRDAITLLGQAVKGLEEEILDQETASPLGAIVKTAASRDLSKVFVVHGHDGEVREAVARFISEKLGLKPVVLHEQPNKGRTIITKFGEEAASVGFAVVLMTCRYSRFALRALFLRFAPNDTPDDFGKAHDSQDLSARARQNVVFELGFFIGALGAERVAAVVKGDIERPSDFDGVVYISFHKEDWRTKLGQELQAAGYKIDWNKLMGS